MKSNRAGSTESRAPHSLHETRGGSDLVDRLDLGGFDRPLADLRGRRRYDPAVLVTLLVYAYCVGERSSRRIERRCVEERSSGTSKSTPQAPDQHIHNKKPTHVPINCGTPVPAPAGWEARSSGGLSVQSNAVLPDLGHDVQWAHSDVDDDKLHCVYNATGQEIIREHARCGLFPIDRVSRVATTIDPTTDEPS